MSSRTAPSPSAEPRGGVRHKVFLPAEMQAGAAVSRVHLLNLSRTGALLHGDAAPAPGAVVQLSCATATWLARVIWAQQKRFGVVHIVPMAEPAVDALVAGPVQGVRA